MMHNNFNPFGDLPEMPTPQPDNLTDKERMQLATATLLGGCATTAAAIVIANVLCLLFCSCTTTRYVPVNETRTVAAKFSRQFSDEVSWMKVDPQAAAAASGEEDITEGGDNQGGGNNNNPPSGELEG